MSNKGYFKLVVAVSLVLAVAALLWFAAPIMLCYAQGYGYGGGGGGGGGGVVQPGCGIAFLANIIDPDGVLTRDVSIITCCECCELKLEKGTKALSKVGTPLIMLTMFEDKNPPRLPPDFELIGLFRDFRPSGATFDPPATLCCVYEEELLPEGFDERNLTFAMWDEATRQWVLLDSTVYPDEDRICIEVSHFTTFAILAGTTPASFSVSDLLITPEVAGIGDEVSISVLVSNSGYLTGSYEVNLKIGDAVVDTKRVRVGGLASKTVTFTVARDAVGVYTVDVNGLSGTFEVSEAPPPPPPAPPPPPPAPAPPPTPAPPLNWYLIGGIIGGCIVVGIVIWQVVIRRGAG